MQNVIILDLDYLLAREERFGQFSSPTESIYEPGARIFRIAQDVCEHTLAWTWLKSFTQSSLEPVRDRVRGTLQQSERLQKQEDVQEWRAEHDVFLAHLALLLGSGEQLNRIAESLVFATGANELDLAQRAWAGLLKFSVLQNYNDARSQAKMMYSAEAPMNLRLPKRDIVEAWLNRDWVRLRQRMKAVYSAMWGSLKTEGQIITENTDRIEITLRKRNLRTGWTFPEIAFALLADTHTRDIPTDPLWFPVRMRSLQSL